MPQDILPSFSGSRWVIRTRHTTGGSDNKYKGSLSLKYGKREEIIMTSSEFKTNGYWTNFCNNLFLFLTVRQIKDLGDQ